MNERGTPQPAPIRVIVADDHPVVRSGIKNMLSAAPDIEIVGEAATGEEALRLARREAPDVLLLDVEMPELSGVEVARRLKGESATVRVLALSSYDDPEYVRGLVASGASGYLTKEAAPHVIVDAVRAVARGEVRWFVRPGRVEVGGEKLTEREEEVLRLLAEGRSNRAVAEALPISEHTVRSHVRSIYDKLDVSSAREAIAWAWQSGFMSR